MNNLNDKIIQLFEKLLYSGTLIGIKNRELTFKLKDSEIKIRFYATEQQSEVIIEPISLYNCTVDVGFSISSFYNIPQTKELFKFEIITPYRIYDIPKVSLFKHAEYIERINNILYSYEEHYLNSLL